MRAGTCADHHLEHAALLKDHEYFPTSELVKSGAPVRSKETSVPVSNGEQPSNGQRDRLPPFRDQKKIIFPPTKGAFGPTGLSRLLQIRTAHRPNIGGFSRVNKFFKASHAARLSTANRQTQQCRFDGLPCLQHCLQHIIATDSSLATQSPQ